jgi:hypothetical protein
MGFVYHMDGDPDDCRFCKRYGECNAGRQPQDPCGKYETVELKEDEFKRANFLIHNDSIDRCKRDSTFKGYMAVILGKAYDFYHRDHKIDYTTYLDICEALKVFGYEYVIPLKTDKK